MVEDVPEEPNAFDTIEQLLLLNQRLRDRNKEVESKLVRVCKVLEELRKQK